MTDTRQTTDQTTTQTTAQTSKQTPELIEADIERQRDELAATVTELQARLDVKSRAKERFASTAHELRDRATTSSGKPRTDLAVAAAVAVAAMVGLIIWRARR